MSVIGGYLDWPARRDGGHGVDGLSVDAHDDSVRGLEAERMVEEARGAISARHLQLNGCHACASAEFADRRDDPRAESVAAAARCDVELGDDAFGHTKFEIIVVSQNRIAAKWTAVVDDPARPRDLSRSSRLSARLSSCLLF